jgi:transposase
MPLRPKKKAQSQPVVLQHDSAGIDIGATEIFVAVPPDRAEQSVRCFGAFTEDLHALADWLKLCRVKTVAMESTGVYWIPVFQILEARGFEVCLVNARHVKNVPGRKSDVLDCQWLLYLHSVGLLRGCFRPSEQVCALRSLLRHRDMLVKSASRHVQHMQKSLTQMNLQLHHVIADLTGTTGLAILDAILAGQRDPVQLAALRDRRVKASEQVVAKSLVGDYRPEHLFTLKSALGLYRGYRQELLECDGEIERMLAGFESKAPLAAQPSPEPGSKPRKAQRNAPSFDVAGHLRRILGVDLTVLPGLGATTVHTLFSEVGADLSKFPTAKHFASWLGLCPDQRVSGGKVLSGHTRKVRSRAAYALRMAAYSAGHSHSALGEFYRRMRSRLGAPKAITATAHKLARVIFHLLRTGQPYDESVFSRNEELYRQRREHSLRKQAKEMGFTLAPMPTTLEVS